MVGILQTIQHFIQNLSKYRCDIADIFTTGLVLQSLTYKIGKNFLVQTPKHFQFLRCKIFFVKNRPNFRRGCQVPLLLQLENFNTFPAKSGSM